jgi:hypothetical protein
MEEQVNAKLGALAGAVSGLNEPDIYRLTARDFDDALAAAGDVLAETEDGVTGLCSNGQRRTILERVRKVVGWVSGDADGWNSQFMGIVQDAAHAVLVRGEED